MTQQSKDTVPAILASWIEAFNARNLETISALYSPGAVLWGTYAPTLITTPEGIRAYFSSAFNQGLTARVVPDGLQTQVFESICVCSGSYVVSLQDEAGLVDAPARFTLVIAPEYGHWRIVNHHSSLNPVRT